MRTVFSWLASLAILFLITTGTTVADTPPNIILIMVDDMGFSDIGCYGGEIETPNIDTLAAGGVRFSHFYNNSRCCPTRATLLTGLYAHQTGIGHMVGRVHDRKLPSYRGALHRKCVTIAEALKPAGYTTLMTGKWHLGELDQSYWPLQRGFDKFYGCLTGSMRYFHPEKPKHITSMNEAVAKPASTTDRAFYTTDAFTDHAIQFVKAAVAEDDSRPFFLYLAYNAPHWPLQAHEEDIDKYRKRYSMGWDQLREQRYQRQIELGLIDPTWKLSPRDPQVPAWSSLDAGQQELESLRMAVYAAMVDRVDQNIGKLNDTLKTLGIEDNTLILFLSDNGACQEGQKLGQPEFADPEKRNLEVGGKTANYGRPWANASSTPFRYYKHHTYEGGAATPLIMHWPAGIKPQKDWYASNSHIIDVMPTLLSITKSQYPSSAHGNPLPPLPGVSLAPAFVGQPLKRPAPIFNEHQSNGLVIDGDWKLVANKVAVQGGPKEELWELYNLKADRTELLNLADQHPERAQEMAAAWKSWAEQVKVFPKPAPRTKPKRKQSLPRKRRDNRTKATPGGKS
ncbi:MAG: arylsulfatase [Planctomycetota bacterium]